MSSSTVVLITGANSGIGYATSKVIASASEKYHVIMASRSAENGKAALAELNGAEGIKGSLSTIQLDITDQQSIDAAAKHVESEFGRLDVLINNAGIASADPSFKVQLETTFRTNVIGPAMVTEAFKPLLLKSKSPYLIYVSSGLGSLGLATDPKDQYYGVPAQAYRVSKSALNMLAVQDLKVLGKEGVKVFPVCPGLVTSNLRGKAEHERTAGGVARDPELSGQMMLGIIEGKKDSEMGKFVNIDGIFPW